MSLLTADEADALHEPKRQTILVDAERAIKRAARECEEKDKRYREEELPLLVDAYITYLAGMQQAHKMPFSVKEPPRMGEELINQRLAPYHLVLEVRCTDHEFDPFRYSLRRLK